MNLYLTADTIGGWSGGSQVVTQEAAALRELGPCEVWDRNILHWESGLEPWQWDIEAFHKARHRWGIGAVRGPNNELPALVHCYAGTFSQTVENLKFNQLPVTYTCAAHDLAKSRAAHEELGFDFAVNYPHLCDPALWNRYVRGYQLADVVICPSLRSAEIVRAQGCTNRIEVIPHGVQLPPEVKPLPPQMIFGYLGSYGCDKGVVYLLQAWKKLNYQDATLVLAGKDSTSRFTTQLMEQFGGGTIVQVGWVEYLPDFYNQISCYVQPSITEGFGIEVLEALAHGRPVLCSDGAGAADVVPGEDWIFTAGDVDALAAKINWAKNLLSRGAALSWLETLRMEAWPYQWPFVRERYKQLWNSLLSSG